MDNNDKKEKRFYERMKEVFGMIGGGAFFGGLYSLVAFIGTRERHHLSFLMWSIIIFFISVLILKKMEA